MQDHCIIPADNPIGISFRNAVKDKKLLFVAGLPSSGKSLLLQQLTILADQAGRRIHTMQWDAARRSFETGHWLSIYPEVDDLTHPGIRKAVGLWVRGAVADWAKVHQEDTDILIAELPVVGGRFAELLQPHEDRAEAVIASDNVQFFVPIPTEDMRKVITGHRAETFTNPRNEQETKDAPIYIVESDWLAARQLYNSWNGIENDAQTDAEYSSDIYRAVFERLLRMRNFEILSIDRAFQTTGSAYDRTTEVTELAASPEMVEATFAKLQQQFPGDAVQSAVANWAEY
jgi:hypothetical protein